MSTVTINLKGVMAKESRRHVNVAGPRNDFKTQSYVNCCFMNLRATKGFHGAALSLLFCGATKLLGRRDSTPFFQTQVCYHH